MFRGFDRLFLETRIYLDVDHGVVSSLHLYWFFSEDFEPVESCICSYFVAFVAIFRV